MERKYPRQDKIINLLHERHLSQREFAEQIGMKEDALSNKLNGHRTISVYEAYEWSRALGVSVEEIFVVEGEQK